MKMLTSALLAVALCTSTMAAPPKKEAPTKEPSKEALAIAKTLTPTQAKKLMDIVNKGDDEALTSLPGIGPKLAGAIKKARPVNAASDLVLIDGIGNATLGAIVKHAKDGFPSKEKAEEKKGSGDKSSKSSKK